MSAAALAIDAERALTPEGFTDLFRRQLETEIQIYPARAWYPSQLGHPCDRYLVWRFTKWQDQRKHDWILQAIFDEGRLHQPSVYHRLEQLGFDVVRESDRPTQYPVGRAVISGRLDGKIRGFKTERFRPPRVLEIKSMAAYQFDRISSIADILASDHYYVREYADQGYIYSFLENLPQGVIALKNKATGVVKMIPFELDFGRAEELLQRVERLQPMVDKAIDPEPIPYDSAICGRCPFLHLCYPPKDFGAGAGVIDDAMLIEDLVARERVKPARDQYEDLDKSIKARLKRLGMKAGAQAVAGPFLVQVAERSVKEYTVKARVDTIFEIERLEPPAAQEPTPAAAQPGPADIDPRAITIQEIEQARAAMRKPMPEKIWAGVCREICRSGPENLAQADPAALNDLLSVLRDFNAKNRTAADRLNAIARRIA
jgi:hypothetical protein